MTRRLLPATLLLAAVCAVALGPLAPRAAAQAPAQAPAQDNGLIPPIKEDILDAHRNPVGQVLIYPDYVELLDASGAKRGAIGIVEVQGRSELFLVRNDAQRHMIGWARDHKLYNGENKLVGYYVWTPVWSYVYDPKMKKVGQAQCIAYQGVCAAGVAGFLLGLL